MMLKKILGGIGAAAAFIILTLAAAGVITWRLFWMAIIVLGALAYLVMPYIGSEK